MSTISLTSTGRAEPAAVHLAPARILTLRGAAGARVRCYRGRGWITVEGDPADYWVSAGEEVQIHSPGRVVIETEPAGELQVTLPPKASTSIRPAGTTAVAF